MLEILKAFVYGIVEGITEWLPISSTGHLILVEKFLPFTNVSEGFFEMFDVVIQLGAIMAVVILFWKRIWPFAFTDKERDKEARRRFEIEKATGSKGKMPNLSTVFRKDVWEMWFHILVSCVPAVIVGLLFDEVFERLFYNPVSIAIALIVFGIAFIVVEIFNKKRQPKITALGDITYTTALLIGLFQVLAAIFPGTSRSGATIVGALLIGVSRTVAAEYTFFLAIPVMFGASLLKIVKFGLDFTALELGVLAIGTIVAFVVSLFVLRFLMNYIKKHDFKIFGWYRIALGAIVLLLAFLGVI